MCLMSESNVGRRMGVTVDDRRYPCREQVPDEALKASPGLSLDIELLDVHIEHWSEKEARAANPVERAMAGGHISGLQLVRVLHGLPMHRGA